MLFQRKNRLLKTLNDSFGTIKNEGFNFDLIKRYKGNKLSNNPQQILSDQTCNDLDFDLFFCYVDRTNSKIGQQYLYNKLRTINYTSVDFSQQEEIIDFLNQNPADRLEIQLQLQKLNQKQTYFLVDLFQEEIEQKSKWHALFPILSFTALALIPLSFFSSIAALSLLVLIPIHVLIHFGFKRKTTLFINAIPSLLSLGAVAKYLFKYPTLTKSNPELEKSLRVISAIRRKMSFFKLEQKIDSDMEAAYWFLLEFIKIIFLLEPLLYFSSLDKLKNKSTDIENIFNFVGLVDCYISICSLRKGVDEYCIPKFTDQKKQLQFENLRHPLIVDCVPNSIDSTKSMLLTGSNMSGKTTFIRSIGLNFISGITLNTCFSSSVTLPLTQLFSIIRIEDDLMSASSYFFKEVDEIKTILNETEKNSCSIILLDELFKGTNTIERIAAAKAVLSYLEKSDNKIFVSTHDIELTDLLKEHFELFHFSEKIVDEKIQFDYKLKEGKPEKGNAIRILELNGFPKEIVDEAKSLVALS